VNRPLVALALAYLTAGAGIAAWLVVRRGAHAVEGVVIAVLWPLYLPFSAPRADSSLPAQLPARRDRVDASLAEIDAWLARLAGAPEPRAAAAAAVRVEHVRRLQGLRERFARERSEIDELICALDTDEAVRRLEADPDRTDCEAAAQLEVLLCELEADAPA
jgi:hypothetical protein